jgi:hypothetical protein
MVIQWPNNEPIELPGQFDYLVLDDLRIAAGYRSYFSDAPYSNFPRLGSFNPYLFANPDASAELPEVDDLGPETVTTPAGTFSTEHFRYERNSGDVWVAREAAPFALVKAVTKDHTTMTLTRLLTDAKDKITEMPRDFDAKRDKQLLDDLQHSGWDVDEQGYISPYVERFRLWDIIHCPSQP